MSKIENILFLFPLVILGCNQNHFSKEDPTSKTLPCSEDECPGEDDGGGTTTTSTSSTTTTLVAGNDPQIALSVKNGAGVTISNGGSTCSHQDLPDEFSRKVSLHFAATGLPRADKFWCKRKTAPADTQFRDCSRATLEDLLFVGDDIEPGEGFVRESNLSARISGYSGLTNRVYQFEGYAESTDPSVINKISPVKSFSFVVEDCGLNCPDSVSVDLAYQGGCTISPCPPAAVTRLTATVTGDTQGRMLEYKFFECDNPSNVFGVVNTTQKTASVSETTSGWPGPHCVIVKSTGAPAGACPPVYGEARD